MCEAKVHRSGSACMSNGNSTQRPVMAIHEPVPKSKASKEIQVLVGVTEGMAAEAAVNLEGADMATIQEVFLQNHSVVVF